MPIRLLVAGSSPSTAVASEGPQIACAERRVLVWFHSAIDAAASTTTDAVVGMLPADLSHIIRRVTFQPTTALTHDGTDFLTLNVTRLDLTGGSGDVIATISTDTTDWSAWTGVALTVDPAFSTWNYPPESPQVRGTGIRVTCSKTNSGVKLPQGALCIEYDVFA